MFTVQCTVCNTQCMSKTSKILKCTCIDFRRTIQISTAHGLSWGADVGLEIVGDDEVEGGGR